MDNEQLVALLAGTGKTKIGMPAYQMFQPSATESALAAQQTTNPFASLFAGQERRGRMADSAQYAEAARQANMMQSNIAQIEAMNARRKADQESMRGLISAYSGKINPALLQGMGEAFISPEALARAGGEYDQRTGLDMHEALAKVLSSAGSGANNLGEAGLFLDPTTLSALIGQPLTRGTPTRVQAAAAGAPPSNTVKVSPVGVEITSKANSPEEAEAMGKSAVGMVPTLTGKVRQGTVDNTRDQQAQERERHAAMKLLTPEQQKTVEKHPSRFTVVNGKIVPKEQ